MRAQSVQGVKAYVEEAKDPAMEWCGEEICVGKKGAVQQGQSFKCCSGGVWEDRLSISFARQPASQP